MKTMNNILKLSLLSLLIFNGQCVDAVTVKKPIRFIDSLNNTKYMQDSIFMNGYITIHRKIAIYPDESNEPITTYTTTTRDSERIRSICVHKNKIVYSHVSTRNNPDNIPSSGHCVIIKQLRLRGIQLFDETSHKSFQGQS